VDNIKDIIRSQININMGQGGKLVKYSLVSNNETEYPITLHVYFVSLIPRYFFLVLKFLKIGVHLTFDGI
jgi:hypothetical protein